MSQDDLLGHVVQESQGIDALIGDVLDDIGVDEVDDILNTLDGSDDEDDIDADAVLGDDDDEDEDDDDDQDTPQPRDAKAAVAAATGARASNRDDENDEDDDLAPEDIANVLDEDDDLAQDDIANVLDGDDDIANVLDDDDDEPEIAQQKGYAKFHDRKDTGNSNISNADSDRIENKPLINPKKQDKQKQGSQMQGLAAIGVDSVSSLGVYEHDVGDQDKSDYVHKPENTGAEFDQIIDDLGDFADALDADDNIQDSQMRDEEEAGAIGVGGTQTGGGSSGGLGELAKSLDDDTGAIYDDDFLDDPEMAGDGTGGRDTGDYKDMDEMDDMVDKQQSLSVAAKMQAKLNETWEAREEKYIAIDEACMMLLTPDYFNEANRAQRLELLKQNHPGLKEMDQEIIDEQIVGVSEAMGIVNHVKMYDTEMKSIIDPKLRVDYILAEVDLSQVKGIPKRYFEGTGDDDGGGSMTDNSKDESKSGTHDESEDGSDGDGLNGGGDDDFDDDDFGEIDVDDLLDDPEKTDSGLGMVSTGLGGTLKKIGKGKEPESKIVCGGCGLKLKFKAKRRNRDNFVAYHCTSTKKFYVFHDHVCVYLRKVKEAIRMYVFLKEKEENPDDPDLDSNFINIDVDEHIKSNQRMRPRHHTTPKKGDFNYKDETVEDDLEESQSSNVLGMGMGTLGLGSGGTLYDAFNPLTAMFGAGEEKEDEKQVKYRKFREYRMQVDGIWHRFNAKVTQEGQTYKDRFGDLPKLLVYSDLKEMGIPVWEFIADALKSKQRVSLWRILRFLALEMSTNKVLDLLKRHTHLLSKHMLREYDEVCKSTMEGSKHPIATALRLSAFMYERAAIDLSNSEDYREVGDQYGTIARRLLQGIESDHLFAMLLQMPTDLDDLCIIEIALKYNLTYFLEDPRIVRVFNVVWFGALDFLDPKFNFGNSELTLPEVYGRLLQNPGKFYFSPIGKFYSRSVLYLVFLFLFTYVTYQQVYYYEDTALLQWYEYVFWPCTMGYVLHEVVEMVDDPKDYFGSTANFFDIWICSSWLVLAFFRFYLSQDPDLEFSSSGQIFEEGTRNLPVTQVYIFLWAMQCLLLWGRLSSLIKTTRSMGPLMRMVVNMLGDIGNFALIASVFIIGVTFAVYYIVGDDLEDSAGLGGQGVTGFQSVGMFIFRTLIGDPEWDNLASYTTTTDAGASLTVFSAFRSNLAIGYIGLFSIFGTILLLNLLIAMMAESYETVKSRSKRELNKQRIDKTWDLDRTRAVIPPPVNLCAYLIYVYFFAFETIVWLLTFGHRQFNEDYFNPLNKKPKHYRVGDKVKFEKGGQKMKAKVVYRTPIVERTKYINETWADRRKSTMPNGNNNGNMVWDLQVRHARKTYDLRDSDVIKVKKSLYKRRKTRIPTADKENEYCRFCRFNISGETMSLDYYFHLFEQNSVHVDPEDKVFMVELLESHNRPYNLPNPKLCELCPNCYRPFFIGRDGTRDVLDRKLLIFEVSSYLAFRWVVWPIMVILMFFPANVAKIIQLSKKILLLSLGGEEEDEGAELEAQKNSVENYVEQNDDYRGTVERVSKQELDVNRLVKRIDLKVLSLEREILHSKEDEFDFTNIQEDEEEDKNEQEVDENLIFRADEYNKRVDRIQREMNQRFDEMKKLLIEAGLGQKQYDDD